MKTNIYSLLNPPGPESSSENACGEVTLSERLFGQPVRGDILARVVRWQQACRRAGTHASKGISQVSGTTRKPFKQKGTGKARQGSLRSPQFRGGGIIFGPQVRSHAYALPKNVRRLGMVMALSSKASEGSVSVLDKLSWEAAEAKSASVEPGKTAALRAVVNSLGPKILFVSASQVDNLFRRSIQNWPRVSVLPVCGLNVYDILRYNQIVFEKEALPLLETRLLCAKAESGAETSSLEKDKAVKKAVSISDKNKKDVS